MEKNNEKTLRPYVLPEVEIVELKSDGVICQSTLEPGQGGGGI